MRPGRLLPGALAALALPALAALGFYLAGNGVTVSALALATVPAGLLAGAAWASGRRPRVARLALVGLLALDGAYIAWRLERTSPARAALQLCERGECGGSPPLLSRLAPESETARAGMAMCGALGLIRDPERSELQRLLEREYGAIDRTPGLAALPSAPLLGLWRGDGRALLWQPPGKNRVPGVIFLHGFGGQLTVYLKALIDGGLGDSHALLAPFGGQADQVEARRVDRGRQAVVEQVGEAILLTVGPPEAGRSAEGGEQGVAVAEAAVDQGLEVDREL
ncbi:MAG: hypothetical protein EOO75_01165, partial [Myxococcales bacterium]